MNSFKTVKSIGSPFNMKMELEDDVPVYHRPRRTLYENKCFMEKQVQE